MRKTFQAREKAHRPGPDLRRKTQCDETALYHQNANLSNNRDEGGDFFGGDHGKRKKKTYSQPRKGAGVAAD